MPALIECVPNFSEGRDCSKVERIATIVETIPDVRVLDLHFDPDHNRSVITFAGPPDVVGEACVRAVGEVAANIYLATHRGVHPRIGAADVVPFAPSRHRRTCSTSLRWRHRRRSTPDADRLQYQFTVR